MSISTAIINKSPPYSTANAKESLDLALVMGSFEQAVGLFFCDDGVYQLVKGQVPSSIKAKDLTKTLKALPFYDIEKIYVCHQSLIARNLSVSDLCVDVTELSFSNWQTLLNQYQHVVTF